MELKSRASKLGLYYSKYNQLDGMGETKESPDSTTHATKQDDGVLAKAEAAIKASQDRIRRLSEVSTPKTLEQIPVLAPTPKKSTLSPVLSELHSVTFHPSTTLAETRKDRPPSPKKPAYLNSLLFQKPQAIIDEESSDEEAAAAETIEKRKKRPPSPKKSEFASNIKYDRVTSPAENAPPSRETNLESNLVLPGLFGAAGGLAIIPPPEKTAGVIKPKPTTQSVDVFEETSTNPPLLKPNPLSTNVTRPLQNSKPLTNVSISALPSGTTQTIPRIDNVNRSLPEKSAENVDSFNYIVENNSNATLVRLNSKIQPQKPTDFVKELQLKSIDLNRRSPSPSISNVVDYMSSKVHANTGSDATNGSAVAGKSLIADKNDSFVLIPTPPPLPPILASADQVRISITKMQKSNEEPRLIEKEKDLTQMLASSLANHRKTMGNATDESDVESAWGGSSKQSSPRHVQDKQQLPTPTAPVQVLSKESSQASTYNPFFGASKDAAPLDLTSSPMKNPFEWNSPATANNPFSALIEARDSIKETSSDMPDFKNSSDHNSHLDVSGDDFGTPAAETEDLNATVLYEASVCFNFDSGIATDLKLRVGDTVSILKEDGEWSYGFSNLGKGWFPGNFVARMKTNEPMVSALVLFDFSAQHDDELTVAAGDTVHVLNDEGDWWQCSLAGNVGLVPGNFMEKVASTGQEPSSNNFQLKTNQKTILSKNFSLYMVDSSAYDSSNLLSDDSAKA
jgi:hypothetical protein